jgi:hypothetical protein
MNNEQNYTEQPFNLETALKHPEWVRTRDGREIDFIKEYPNRHPIFSIIAVLKEGSIYLLNKKGKLGQLDCDNDLIIGVPYVEKWACIYPSSYSKKFTIHDSKEQAEKDLSSISSYIVPIKVPAI